VAKSPPTPDAPIESLPDEVARLERQAAADERALSSLRDDLHNATHAVAQASGERLAPALTQQRALQRELDATLASAMPVLERLNVVRQTVMVERRVAQVANLRTAGVRFAEAAEPVTQAFTDAFDKLATLMAAASAVTEAGRGCGPDVLRDVQSGMQLASVKSWLLSRIAATGLTLPPAVLQYDPHQLTEGVTPTAASADLSVYLETTR
jgi:hypothetical protein